MTTVAPRTRAGVVVTWVVAVVAILLATSLAWGLRRLIVPAFVGGVLAYICRPLVAGLERRRIPRTLAAALLLLVFGLATLVGLNSLRTVMPTELEALELRVRALHALTRSYQALMGLDPSWTRGNRLYWAAHRDLDPLIDLVREVLALTPDERAQLVAGHTRGAEAPSPRSRELLERDRGNAEALARRARRTGAADPGSSGAGALPTRPAPTALAPDGPPALAELLSDWLIAPLLFVFLLCDSGEIKRGLLGAVPNRLFEPVLSVLAEVDRALGDYVRGIFLECCALGLTVALFVALVGVPLRWAIAIGIGAGASNVVPYMGFAAALLSGLAYGLLAEDIRPLIPFVTADTFALAVIAAVALAELLKNIVYEPLVLGRAVKLHPLVVVIGVVAGATLFGPAGMLLAIPTITVVKVLVASSARHLKAYGLV
jgi:predicted PurR-regulated permease PerM